MAREDDERLLFHSIEIHLTFYRFFLIHNAYDFIALSLLSLSSAFRMKFNKFFILHFFANILCSMNSIVLSILKLSFHLLCASVAFGMENNFIFGLKLFLFFSLALALQRTNTWTRRSRRLIKENHAECRLEFIMLPYLSLSLSVCHAIHIELLL